VNVVHITTVSPRLPTTVQTSNQNNKKQITNVWQLCEIILKAEHPDLNETATIQLYIVVSHACQESQTKQIRCFTITCKCGSILEIL